MGVEYPWERQAALQCGIPIVEDEVECCRARWFELIELEVEVEVEVETEREL